MRAWTEIMKRSMYTKVEPESESVTEQGTKGIDDRVLVTKIIRFILTKQEPVSLEEVCKIVGDKEKIEPLFANHMEKFSIRSKVFVDLKLKINICKDHCSKQRCSNVHQTCSALHICKYYATTGKCKFGRMCSFGHDLTTEHNIDVLSKNYLTDISAIDLNYLFKKESNRLVPEICKFYNVDNDTCKHSGKTSMCPFLHICKYFVNGTCKFGTKCQRSHLILDSVNENVLQNHGIDTARTPNEVLKELQMMIKKNRQKNETDSEMDKIKRTNRRISRRIEKMKTEPVGELDISLSSDISEGEDHKLQVGDLSKNKGQLVDEESKSRDDFDPTVHVTILSDSLPFRYRSQIESAKGGPKQDRQDKNVTENGYLAEVSISNYEGKATIVAFCVDSDDNIHPFNLYGTNCEDGVYKHECLIVPDKPEKLFGESILTPTVSNYEKKVKNTDAYLKKCGVTDTKICKAIKDKYSVYLRVVVYLEDCDNKVISSTSTVIQKKCNGKNRFNESSGVKRAFSCPGDGNISKRLRTESVPYRPGKVFETCVNSKSSSTWGNFIDTSGYEESALTWQAHGEALQSVCMIVFPRGKATGFRVGQNKNYIMTAAHVVDHILKAGLRRIGRTNLTSLNNAQVYALFGYLKEGEMEIKNKFLFNGKVHFHNADTDTAILELSESVHGTPMPPPLLYFRGPDLTNKFYFLGHSEGKPLGINKVDKIVDMNSKESKIDRANVRQWSKSYTQCPECPQGREYDLEGATSLTNKNRFLFHCKFTKGASGSPGIVCLSDGRKAVVTMLLCGYPVWYYDPSMETFKANWSQDCLCVEQGVKFQSVHNIMKEENAELCKDIFGNETDN